MLNISGLSVESEKFIYCRIPRGKPVRRRSASCPLRNRKPRPAESVNDMGRGAVFEHGFKKKPLHSAFGQRIRPIGLRIEKNRFVAARKPPKLVCECQADCHQAFCIKSASGTAPPHFACHCDPPTRQKQHA